jgi:hypothetical protein
LLIFKTCTICSDIQYFIPDVDDNFLLFIFVIVTGCPRPEAYLSDPSMPGPTTRHNVLNKETSSGDGKERRFIMQHGHVKVKAKEAFQPTFADRHEL